MTFKSTSLTLLALVATATAISAEDTNSDWGITPRLSVGYGNGVRTAKKDYQAQQAASASHTNEDTGGLITEALVMGRMRGNEKISLLAGIGFFKGASQETLTFTNTNSKTEITNDYDFTGARVYAGLSLGSPDSKWHLEGTPFVGTTKINADSKTKTGSTEVTSSKSGSATTYGGTLGAYYRLWQGAELGIRAGGYGGNGSVDGGGSKTNLALSGLIAGVDVGWAF